MAPMNLGLGLGLSRRVGGGAPSAPAAPVITGVPTISGTIRTGQTLEATAASVSGSPTPTRTWQWRRDGVDISGATASTYTITNLDEGRSLTVRQTETNANGSANATSTATAVPLLLDQLTAAPLLALSTRRLRSAYTGPLLRQRRASDNTEQDVPYGTDNRLNTTTLLAFAGSGSSFGAIWYDQSGNGRDHPNATLSAQPRIVNSGVVDALNGQPAFNFNGSQGFSRVTTGSYVYANAGGSTMFFPQNFANADGRAIFSEFSFSTPAEYSARVGVGLGAGLFPTIFDDANGGSTPIVPFVANVANNTPTVGAFRDSGTFMEGFRDGVRGNAGVTYTRPGGAFTSNRTRVGFNESSGGMVGNMPEFIILSGAVSNLDLNTVIASQGGEYGISVTPFLVGEDLEFSTALSRDAMFGEFNQNWEGYTGTIASGDRPNSGTVGYPTVMRMQLSALRNEDNKIVASASSLTNFDSWGLGLHLGATAKVFRVINGVMTPVRESTVTGGKIGAWQWRRFQSLDGDGNLVDDNRIIDGTSFRFNVESFSQPNVPYWFRVSAVGSNGLNGAWSAPVSYTPSSVAGAFNNVPNTPKSFNRTGSGGALPAPTGLTAVQGNAPRVASLTWDPVSGAEGYIVQVAYYDPATEIDEAGAYLDLSPHPTPIRSTDFILLENQFLTLNDSMICRRTYTADALGLFKPDLLWFEISYMNRGTNTRSYVPFDGPKPPGVIVDHFFRTTAPAGVNGVLQRFWQGGPAQTGYQYLVPGTTQRLRIIARASTPLTATFTPGGTLNATTFNLTTDWQEFVYDMPVVTPMTLQNIADWQFTFPGGASGASVDMAFFELKQVGSSNNILASTPPALGGYLRDHSFIKADTYNRSLSRLVTNPVYGFRQFYDTCKSTGSKPWFQIEWNMPRQEVIDFVAYLAAPNGSHPMADLRLASGIPQPWTTEFPDIKLEWGNEAWQPPNLPAFWGFRSNMTDSVTGVTYRGGLDGDVAGLFWQMISNWMKESPYWSTLAPKLTQHLGGFISNDFGEDAYRYYQDATEVSIAPYIGGWESGSRAAAESGEAFEVILADAMSKQKPTADARIASLKAVCAATGKTYGTDVRWTIYEGGPGYQLPGRNDGLTRIAEEVVMKSRAAATATVDGMLTYAQRDFKNFNFFMLGTGSWWRSHAGVADGGQEYPVHALPRIIHDNIAPARVYGARTEAIGTKPGRTNAGVSGTINQIGAYQLRNLTDPSKRMIVVVNRNIDPSQLPVTDPMYSATPSGTVAFNVTTTWNSATSLKVWTAGVGPYRQHNRYPVGQRRDASGALVSDPLCVAFDYSSTTVSVPANIKDFAIDASVGATSAGLPAGSCLIMLFEGVT